MTGRGHPVTRKPATTQVRSILALSGAMASLRAPITLARILIAAGLGLPGLAPSFADAAPARPPSTARPTPAPPAASDPDAGASAAPTPGKFHGCDEQPKGARFRVTLPQPATLEDLIDWMSSVSCQKFIWDHGIRGGKAMIVAPEPVTLHEAYGAFHSALETMHLTVEQAGDVYEIVELKDVQGRTIPVHAPGERPRASDRFVTQLLRPHEDRLADVSAALEHLKSPQGAVKTVGEVVIVTDTAYNVRRLLDVVDQLDVETPADDEGLYVAPLKWSDPEEVASIVLETFAETPSKKGRGATKKSGGAASKGRRPTKAKDSAVLADAAEPAAGAHVTRVLPHARTRSLVIVAPREDWPVIQRLIERLDIELPSEQGQLRVVRLQHADPVEVQKVLTDVMTQGAERGGGSEVKITADEATHSLVIDAPHHEYRRIEGVIEDLDVKRSQVYMEVYLLEVRLDHGNETGLGAHFAAENSDGTLGFIGTAPSPETSTVGFDPSGLAGIMGGIFGRPVFVPQLGRDIPSFGVLIQALAVDTDVNLVSEPHVTTADNKTAKIEVGRKVPVVNGLAFPGGAGGDGGLTPVQNVTREPVSLKVEITPHVADGTKEMTLDIALEHEEIVESAASNLGITSTTRALELEDILARDGQPVVLGGLVQESDEIGSSGVPGISKVPLLGWFFKKRKRKREKMNLLIVVVPHVIDSADDARRIHRRRLEERQEFLERETRFKRKDLETHVNYRRKSGLLASVNREHGRMRAEDDHRRLAEAELAGLEVVEIDAP